MQTLIDLPEEELTKLTEQSNLQHVSPSEIMREALKEYLQSRDVRFREDAINDAFGLWAEHFEDGQAYQDRMRAEWNQRDFSTPTS